MNGLWLSIPMTDPAGAGILMLTWLGYIDGIHGTPYIIYIAASAGYVMGYLGNVILPTGYGSIPIDTFLVGWTSIYQLFWCSPGVQGFGTLPTDFHSIIFQDGHIAPPTRLSGDGPPEIAGDGRMSSHPFPCPQRAATLCWRGRYQRYLTDTATATYIYICG